MNKRFLFVFFRKEGLLLERRSKIFCLLVLVSIGCARAQAGNVVSLNLCTDQLLVLLAPERVLALEPLARDPALSFVAEQAARLPAVRADAEAVLRLNPSLVLAGYEGAQTTVALLRARGVPVVQFDEPADFVQVAAQVNRIADLLAVPERGRAMVAAMRRRLSTLHQRHGTAVVWQAGGWTAGSESFSGAVLRAAGLSNAGTGGRMGVEALLTRNPDLLVVEAEPSYPSMATDLARHPALRQLVRIDIPAKLLICGGPFSVGAVEKMAR